MDDELLTGRAGLTYAQLDDAARALQLLVVSTAERQISRPLLHEFEIVAGADPEHRAEPPAGYRRPAAGSITTLVIARSRSADAVETVVRVTVWPALGGSPVTDLLIEREGTDRRLEVRLDELLPEPTETLRHRVHDFVARQVASVVAELNVAMQRRLGDR